MERLLKQDRIDGISVKLMGFKNGRITKPMIRAVLNADKDFVIESLIAGEEVVCEGLGIFKFKDMKPKGERENTLPQFRDRIIEATPAYTRVKFQINKNVNKEIREKTLGKPFEK